MELDHQIEHHGDGGHACAMARDMNQRIIEGDEAHPHFAWVSQNIAAVVALLRGLTGATTPDERRAHREIRMLLERAAT